MANLSSCPSSVKPRRSPRRRTKVVYRVRNWADYDSLTVWCTPQVVEAWYYQGPPQRGAQYTFSEVAIHGVDAASFVSLAPTPNRGVCRFGVGPDGLESTGARSHVYRGARPAWGSAATAQGSFRTRRMKVYGEGEWKVVSTAGASGASTSGLMRPRDRRALTTNRQDDAGQVEPLRAQIEAPIEALGGDGAYDQHKVFDALAAPEPGPPIRPIIPPRRNAKIEQHGNTNAEPLPRDETIRAIRKRGRRAWKKTSSYHRRSITETQIGRYKQMIGDTLRARTLTNQQTETRLGGALLNRMRALAKPESYPLTQKA